MTNPDPGRMSPESQGHEAAEEQLISTVETKEERKLWARRNRNSVWFGFGMFGMVGWSISVPTIACLAIGIWIDRRWPSQYSWTLMFLFIGIVLGCLNAWYWIKRERSQIEQSSTQGRK